MNKLEKRNQRMALENGRKNRKRKRQKESLNVKELFNDLINIPLGEVNHDNLVAAVLNKHEFECLSKEEFKKWYDKNHKDEYKARGNLWQNKMEFWEIKKYPFDRCYIRQPNGSQNNPDYYVFINGACFPLEAKSAKNGSATWNSNYPFEKAVYLFSRTGEKPKTVVYMGEGLVKDEIKECLNEYHKKQRKLADKYNSKLLIIQDDGKGKDKKEKLWEVFPRKMFTNKSIYIDRDDSIISREKIIKKVEKLIDKKINMGGIFD